MTTLSVGREADGWRKWSVRSRQVATGSGTGIRSVLGQRGLRVRLGGKGSVAIDVGHGHSRTSAHNTAIKRSVAEQNTDVPQDKQIELRTAFTSVI